MTNIKENNNLYDKAYKLIHKENNCSISYVQRNLRIGYNTAARLIEQLEINNVITQANKKGIRKIKNESK